MTKFFAALPTLSYNGVPSKNFLALAKLSDDTIANRTLFYPYTVGDHERIDNIAGKYYDNPDYAWLIWMTNNIVDPYHDVYLNERDFEAFVEKKYGSRANAETQIAYWVNDWASDESELTPAAYNAMPASSQKYYNPVVDPNNRAVRYARKQEDWKVNTNQVVSMAVTSTTAYTPGTTVSQRYAANNLHIAEGIVVFSNTTACVLNHTSGGFLASNSTVIVHLHDSSDSIANTITTDIQSCIPSNEVAFWTAVSYYTHETNTNASRRDINLIDNRFAQRISNQLKSVMSE